MKHSLSSVALLALVAAAAPAAGQTLNLGQTLYESLSVGDRYDGTYYDDYSLYLSNTEDVVIDLVSETFDTYLRLYDSGGNQIDSNDDGAGNLDSRIQRRLGPGQYWVRATSFSSSATGAYRLSAYSTGSYSPAAQQASGPAGGIALGGSTWGTLAYGDMMMSDGRYYDDYTVWLDGGTQIRADLMSSDYDAYLFFGYGTGAGFQTITTNDDGGDGLNSQIVWTVPNSGTYTLRATSLGSGVTGGYSLYLNNNYGGGYTQPTYQQPAYQNNTYATPNWSSNEYLGPGDPVNYNGQYYDEWTSEGYAGQRVVILMVSEDFDTYLELGYGQHGSFSPIAYDDDGADTPLDSRLEVVLPYNGTYTIRARALGSGTGYYTIQRF